MSNLDLTDSQTSLPRGSGKPQDGEAVAHTGRGGQNVYINDAASPGHPRGVGMVDSDEEKSATSGFARGSGKPQDGEPMAHPGRGGQNAYINDAPTSNHPRGAGTSQSIEPAQSTSDKQSANDVGLNPQQLAIVQNRINEVMQNQSAIEI